MYISAHSGVNMLGLYDPSNLLFVYPPRSDGLFSNYSEDLFIVTTVMTVNKVYQNRERNLRSWHTMTGRGETLDLSDLMPLEHGVICHLRPSLNDLAIC